MANSPPPTPITARDLPVLVSAPITAPIIYFLTNLVLRTVDFGMEISLMAEPSEDHPHWGRMARSKEGIVNEQREMFLFTSRLLRGMHVPFSVVLGALVYIEKASTFIEISVER